MSTVGDVGEQGVLARLKAFCPPHIIGDDGAVLATEAQQAVVVTTDVLVENVHFSDRTTAPEDVGWRAAAVNLSDLAAMGAAPLGLTIGLSLHREVDLDWLDRLYRGFDACARTYDTAIIGGDVCRSPVVSLAITALGQVAPQNILRRDAAYPGDAIAVTGTHGGARAGLELLLHDDFGWSLTPAQRQLLLNAHRRPRPRLDVLPCLRSLQGSRLFAGMDSSDGLADAVLQICRASGVGARLDADAIPIPAALSTLVTREQALDWALYGGEDFELVLCLPETVAERFVAQIGGQAAIIGKIERDRAVQLEGDTPQILSLQRGFQHF
jgi:thiamine-monophosphate kinase